MNFFLAIYTIFLTEFTLDTNFGTPVFWLGKVSPFGFSYHFSSFIFFWDTNFFILFFWLRKFSLIHIFWTIFPTRKIFFDSQFSFYFSDIIFLGPQFCYPILLISKISSDIRVSFFQHHNGIVKTLLEKNFSYPNFLIIFQFRKFSLTLYFLNIFQHGKISAAPGLYAIFLTFKIISNA